MTLIEVKEFIKDGLVKSIKPEIWADLGCGSGIFTHALCELLPHKSKIYAVDREPQTFNFKNTNVEVEFIQSNIERNNFPFKLADGIIMANALHYIDDQMSFIKKLKKHLVVGGKLILVEYDTDQSNPWVPYPINFNKAVDQFTSSGFREVIKLNERQSIYRKDKMYACLIR